MTSEQDILHDPRDASRMVGQDELRQENIVNKNNHFKPRKNATSLVIAVAVLPVSYFFFHPYFTIVYFFVLFTYLYILGLKRFATSNMPDILWMLLYPGQIFLIGFLAFHFVEPGFGIFVTVTCFFITTVVVVPHYFDRGSSCCCLEARCYRMSCFSGI